MDYLPGDGGAEAESLMYGTNSPLSYVPMYGSAQNPAGALALPGRLSLIRCSCPRAASQRSFCARSYYIREWRQPDAARLFLLRHPPVKMLWRHAYICTCLKASVNTHGCLAGMTLFGRSANVLTYVIVRTIVYFITDPAFVRLRCGSWMTAGDAALPLTQRQMSRATQAAMHNRLTRPSLLRQSHMANFACV